MGDDLAARVAAALWADDTASATLGMRLDAVGEGFARMEMTVRDDMVNGHGIAHGGFVFTLADSAFAFACNARNQVSVAQACDIVFVAPARRGDRLVAEAHERTAYGRNAIYDVTVRRDDAVIAEFRGHSRRLPGTVIKENL
ncbi:phenylacetic acid degradation protein PaaD [Kribbella flavida DSM 17836]|uniref:Phenylacetic acid degradation protein PaaD n=1 Tax=Kribbella flavida (strain DSM 17836 / JCM 10339 / NBRC 14399) TaxID=479435 RepID=D2Q2E4_KRIFD|nr:hydroxyphenylacetyl-CoA thioesterase PaaI [Kribbella flavida]ADB35840.1 phenylacetic acid degradation protein PaaD [Kribbella flavida DSM 17836]